MWAGADVIGPFSINVGPKLQISRRSDSSRKVIAARLLLIRAGRNASINPAGRRYALKLPSPTRRKRRAILNRLDASSCTHRPSRSAENDFGGGSSPYQRKNSARYNCGEILRRKEAPVSFRLLSSDSRRSSVYSPGSNKTNFVFSKPGFRTAKITVLEGKTVICLEFGKTIVLSNPDLNGSAHLRSRAATTTRARWSRT